MSIAIKDIIDRPCTPSESLSNSLKEMNLIRQGKLPRKTWKELKDKLKQENKL